MARDIDKNDLRLGFQKHDAVVIIGGQSGGLGTIGEAFPIRVGQGDKLKSAGCLQAQYDVPDRIGQTNNSSSNSQSHQAPRRRLEWRRKLIDMISASGEFSSLK